jgi:hypothetical protein
VGSRREQLSRRQMIIAEVADGGHIELPVDWTDRGAPWTTPKVDGREVRLGARGLLALSQAVDTALRQKLGPLSPPSAALTEAEHTSKTGDVWCHGRTRGVGGPDADNAARCARHVGKSLAQDGSVKRGRR